MERDAQPGRTTGAAPVEAAGAAAAGRDSSTGCRGRRLLVAITLALILLKLVLSSGKMIAAFAHSDYDEALYLRLAEQIVRTGWLGPYDELTLAKGPVYPFFLAANFVAGTPLLLTQALLHAAAGLLFLRALRPLLPDDRIRLVIFAVYLFNPTTTMGASDIVLRESIYTALAVIVIACAVGVFAGAARGRGILGWSLGLGVTGALFWMTREEGLWLVPATAWLLAAAAWLAWTRAPRPAVRRRRLAGIAAAVLAFFAVDGGWAAVNLHRYGVFTTEEFRYGPFRDAYGALLRVEHPVEEPWIPVPRAVREAIYRESPSFRELQPSLERDWIGTSCDWYSNPHACSDLPGFALVWALRTAAAKAGHFRSGEAMSAYFTTLAREVNEACDAQRLRCGPRRSTLMPPTSWATLAAELPGTFYRAARLVVTFAGTDQSQVPSRPDEPYRDWVAGFTHDEVAPSTATPQPQPGDVVRVAGWVYLPDHRPFTVQLQAGGDPLPIPLRRAEGADVAAHFHDPEAHGLRFELAGTCPAPCSLVVLAGDRATVVPLTAAATGPHGLQAAEGTLYLDRVDIRGAGVPAEVVPAWPRRLKLMVLDVVATEYRAAAPFLILAGLVAYLVMAASLAVGNRSRLLVVETALLGGAVSLAGLVSVVDRAAYPLLSAHYVEPCFAFMLLFACLALSDLGLMLAAWTARWTGRAPRGPA